LVKFMGILDIFRRKNEINFNEGPQRVKVSPHVEEVGSSGTELISGILSEEYLSTLQGTQGADIFDKMRRSDAKLKMALMAVTNPIKGAKWSVDAVSDNTEDQVKADFIDHVFFNDHDKSWRGLLHEILTLVPFGYSLFERVHKIESGVRWGKERVICYKTFAFRSQRTIENWNLDDDGILESVSQYAFGDNQKVVDIPAQFLTLFSLDREGENFEGVSMLRPCYGAWMRKNVYLKLNAIGLEKFAVPTPILTVPEGLEAGDQYAQAVNVLKKYLTHEQNFITKPEGWELDLNTNPYDPSKVQSAIDAENAEMINAFMANFLLLGQSGSGSYALSEDLSDFFLSGIEHISELICEVLNDGPVKEIIDLNFGPQKEYPKIKCSGIRDKAGKELSEVIKMMTESKVIIPDARLEEYVRMRYDLPEASTDGQRITDDSTPQPVAEAQFSEKKKSVFSREKFSNPKKLIDHYDDDLKALLQFHLDAIGKDKATKLSKVFKNNPPGKHISEAKKVEFSGVGSFKLDLKLGLAIVAIEALNQVQNEAPPELRKYKFAEPVEFFGFHEDTEKEKRRKLEKAFGKLPPKVRENVINQADLLSEAQLNDLSKTLSFHYTNSVATMRNHRELEQELFDVVDSVVIGPAVYVGATNIVSSVINATRNSFFFAPDVYESIEVLTFENPNPKTDICTNLKGKTFYPDQPGASRYLPPLHHNCKSYLVPGFVGQKNPKPNPGGLRPTGTEKQIETMEKQIKFGEDLTKITDGENIG